MAVWQVSAEADPIGYAEAKKRWLAQTAKPDASVRVLRNAAYFLERADAPLAEELLLRAKAMTTGSERTGVLFQLGRLYGEVLLGPTDPRDGSPQTRIDCVGVRARSPSAAGGIGRRVGAHDCKRTSRADLSRRGAPSARKTAARARSANRSTACPRAQNTHDV